MNLANKLTIFRIILVPIMMIIPLFNIQGDVFGISLTYIIMDIIFIIASITDKLDGYIARSRNQITTFGKFLDPLADKMLVLTALIMLVEMQKLPSWIPIIVLAREFMVSGYRLIAVEKQGKVIAASKWGKIKTVTQMMAIIIPYWIPAIVIMREFIVSGYRLIVVQKNGDVISASVWGKIKTATQMVGIILAFIDKNSFGAFINQGLTGNAFIFNFIVSAILFVSVIATIFSGINYLKGSKKIFKEVN